LAPINQSGWAIASSYMALFSCIPLVGLLFSVAAVVMGVWALQNINRNRRLGGKVRAYFGIVVGSLTVLGNLLLVLALLAHH
jgi:hypothetical protein